MRFRVFLPRSSTSTLRPVMRTRVIDHGPVYFSWCSLVPYPSRLRVLSASHTSTRSHTFAVTPADERFMVALTRSRAAVRMACLCSRTFRTSKRFCFLCSTKLSRVQVYQVRSLDRPLFIMFAQNSEDIIVTSQTREQGMMECAVSSSLFSVYVIKKRVH